MIQPRQILQKREYSFLSELFNTAFAFIIFLFGTNMLNAKQNNDTIYSVAPEIKVTADRINNSAGSKYSSVFRITPSEIKKINAFQVNELLSKSPGFYIKNYGGAGGMKTVSIRGTNSTQSVIMIDGVPINSAQSASIDLSLIPASFIKEVEISRGGASNLYGSSSVGGAVNLIFDDFTIGEKYGIAYSLASYNEQKLNANYRKSLKNLSYSIGAEFVNSEGDYKYHFNDFGTEKEMSRANAEFNNTAFNASIKYKFRDTSSLSLRTIVSATERGIPDAVVQGVYNSSKAILDEKNAITILSFNKYLNNNDFIKLSSYFKYNKSEYRDSDTLTFDKLKQSNFTNREFRINAKSGIEVYDINFNLNGEFGFCDLAGDMLDYSAGDYVKRLNINFALFAEKSFQLSEVDFININPSIRADYFNSDSPNYSYLLGIMYGQSNTGFRFKNQISKNFRLPSFNEMYYFNYGTKDLKPESSISINSSVTFILFDNVNLEFAGFYINTDNQIVSIPKSPIRWSAENIGKVTSKGIEISTIGSLFTDENKQRINYSFSYTFQSVKDKSENSINYNKQIVYTPKEIFAFSADINYFGFSLGLSGDYASHRFSQPDNSYYSMMSKYIVYNSSLAYSFSFMNYEAKLKFECLNLLAEKYAVVKNYPMPERTFRLGVQIFK